LTERQLLWPLPASGGGAVGIVALFDLAQIIIGQIGAMS
jgi:hypothetical protein